MAIEPLMAIEPVVEQSQLLPSAPVETPPTNFSSWFVNELNSVNDHLAVADMDVKKLAVGGTQNLHEVMIHLEEARLSFQLLVQVRNRLLEAYQDVMRMQV